MFRHIHVSWHIAWTALGILFGVAVAPYTDISISTLPGLLGVGVLLGVTIIRSTRVFVLLAFIAGSAVGLMRGDIGHHQLQAYAPYIGQTLQLQGTITEDTSLGRAGDQRLRMGRVHIDNHELKDEIWASISRKHDIKRGDQVQLEGRLSKGFGNIPAAMYHAKVIRIQRPQPGDIARRIRDWFNGNIREVLPEPEASLGIGFLTGQRSTLPEDLDDQLRLLGLTHIVVASGYNLTILVRLARQLFARVSKYLSALSATTMILGFIAVTGMSPSMSRAGLVAGLSLAAWYYGRTIHPLVLLSFAAATTVLINPSYIWGDIGWYLSFGSFVGVIVVAPLIQHYFWGTDTKPGLFRQILIDTTAAQIVTLPIIASVFGTYSPLAIPANMLILPFVPCAMLFTFVSGLAALLLPTSLASVAALPASLALQYMTSIIHWLGTMPWAEGEIHFGLPVLIGAYGTLTCLIIYLWRKTNHDFRKND